MRSWWSRRSPQMKFLIVVLALVVVYAIATSGTRAATTAPSPTPTTATVAAVTPAPPASTAAAATTSPTISQATHEMTIATATPATVSTGATSSCTLRGPLPDPVCTPGAADPRVTQANVQSTICASGYTTTVRPPTSYTDALKVQQMRAYGFTGSTTDYEEDHLIALEIGGDPRDPRNLWPEPRTTSPGASQKDTLENRLHVAVCAGRMTLAEAQREMATDWVAAAGLRVP